MFSVLLFVFPPLPSSEFFGLCPEKWDMEVVPSSACVMGAWVLPNLSVQITYLTLTQTHILTKPLLQCGRPSYAKKGTKQKEVDCLPDILRYSHFNFSFSFLFLNRFSDLFSIHKRKFYDLLFLSVSLELHVVWIMPLTVSSPPKIYAPLAWKTLVVAMLIW
jgi:hypothetical protein